MGLSSLLIPEPDRLLSGPLRVLYQKFLDARQLLDVGMVAEAWSASASLVRDAQLLGLEEDDGSGGTASKQADREPGRRIWWLLIDLDAQLSFLLGRRPLISSSHGVRRPTVDYSRPEEKDLLQNMLDLSQYMLEVLGTIIPNNCPAKTESEMEKATLESYLNRLQDLHSRFSYLPQNGKADPPLWAAVAEHQFKVHLFLMVLNCQLVMSMASVPSQRPSEGRIPSSSKLKRSSLRKNSSKGYLDQLFQSVRRITSLFEYIKVLDPFPIPPWPRCFGVYCAASVLGIARVRQDIEPLQTDTDRLQGLLKFFQGSLRRLPRSAIAQAAVVSLDGVLDGLAEQQRPPAVAERDSEPHDRPMKTPNDESSHATQSNSSIKEGAADNSGSTQHLKRTSTSMYPDETRAEKRPRYSAMPLTYENSVHGNPPAWQGEQGPSPYAQPMSSFSEMSAASFHESSVQNSFDQGSFAHSAPTSFAGNDQLQYASLGYAASHPDTAAQLSSFPFWMHPPMLIHPPMYHAGWQAMDSNPWMMQDTGQQAFYGGPSAMPVSEPHQHDGNVQASQSAGMNNFAQATASRDDVQATGNMTAPVDNARGANDAQFYATAPGQYQRLDHPASSPIRDDSLSRQESSFGRPQVTDRRRSAADIRPQQSSTWTMEMPADFANQTSLGEQRDVLQQATTPSRDDLLSPVSETEPKSRRNSATPRQIARKGRPPRPKQSDLPAQNVDDGDVSGLRRRSIAHTGDVMMVDMASGGDSRAEPAETRTEQAPVWQNRASNPGLGHPPSSNLYGLEMVGPGHGHAMDYEQNFDPHLPPRQVVTTGPFTGNSGGHHWWAR
ncbi:hypothetical protein A1O3_04298 [Capronia epimyces CBS 606.96]|uniref:Xylanolytic transcriptional activator regulatory domain-containing protein n=1 Tax=Capronia epimyces CBS 606.96 TaxID=1182542 RepID=W9YYI9_9EURO|nr:uncharacterized protein A1O3_04298 [Capronia epimyces CBS 606.96]EXJ87339.1 hypothetical protein A1O3_04298 [Capronia epimyces CBS 606.96]